MREGDGDGDGGRWGRVLGMGGDRGVMGGRVVKGL